MPENTPLEELLALHRVDREIDKLERQKQLLPVSLRSIRQRRDREQDALQAKREQRQKLRVDSLAKESLLKSAEQKIEDLTVKLNTVKSNREYTALQHEITGKKTDASRIEDEILAAMANIEALATEIRNAQAALEKIRREHDDEDAKVDAAAAKFDTDIAKLRRQRAKATEAVDPELLQEYERIAAKKGASALAPVVGNTCQGCFMQLPPQLGHTLAAGRTVITCPSCSRILYLPPRP